MNQWIPYLIKSASILFFLLVYYKLFLRKQTFFQLNRLYLLCALVIAVVTPFISIEIHTLSNPFVPQHPIKTYMSNLLDEVYVMGNYTVSETSTDYNSFDYLLIAYWGGVICFVIRYLYAFVQIQRIKYRNPHRHFHGINMIFLTARQPAFSYFNNLFINPCLNREDRRKIFAHEKIHIRQCHSLDLLIAEIVCISNWFNPLVWIFKNAIMENHEYIADHQVIRRFHTGSYLELLLRQTFRGAFSFTSYFSCSNLKKRTIMMTKKQSRKYWVLSFIPVTALLVTMLYGFTCNKTALPALPIVLPEFTASEEDLAVPLSQQPDTTIFVAVENMPCFRGGNVSKWINKNIRYPLAAVQQKVEGKVFVQFIIEKDGSVGDVKIVRGVNPLLDDEALRVVKSMPRWIPGTQRGKTVRVSYTLPINFSLAPALPSDTVSSELFTHTENMPVFRVGDVQKWIEKNVRYPASAIENKIQGKVYVRFDIEKDGSISNVKVMKGLDSELDREAVRVINIMPAWKPATQKGQPVKISYTLPINFTPPSVQTTKHSVLVQDVLTVPETMPAFPEGNVQQWIARNIKYPVNAVKNRIQGKVYVQFIIENDGSLSNVRILRGVNPELDEEAIRVIKMMPKWIPGVQKGKPVKVSYTLPISFKLS